MEHLPIRQEYYPQNKFTYDFYYVMPQKMEDFDLGAWLWRKSITELDSEKFRESNDEVKIDVILLDHFSQWFTDKESYLDWVAGWKDNYMETAGECRIIKRTYRKQKYWAGQRLNSVNSRDVSERWGVQRDQHRTYLRYLLELRRIAKKVSYMMKLRDEESGDFIYWGGA